jgi:hypothetical protein
MSDATYFERLVATVERIARHTFFPGKDEAVGLCLEDIDELSLEGRITPEQAGVLRGVLLGSPSLAV